VLSVLSVLALALTAVVVLLSSWKGDLTAKESAAQDGLNAATSAAQDFSSYDYRTLESNFKTSANTATGAFRQQYLGMMSQVRAAAEQQQVVVVGTVLKAGVEQVSARQVIALVFLNQETSKLNQPRSSDQYRLRLTVDRVKGRWLVSKVEAV
jgi:Mce-associated membrane protein